MHRARRLLVYVNYMVDCLGLFSGKILKEMIHKNTCIHEQHENHFIASVNIKVFGKILHL